MQETLKSRCKRLNAAAAERYKLGGFAAGAATPLNTVFKADKAVPVAKT